MNEGSSCLGLPHSRVQTGSSAAVFFHITSPEAALQVRSTEKRMLVSLLSLNRGLFYCTALRFLWKNSGRHTHTHGHMHVRTAQLPVTPLPKNEHSNHMQIEPVLRMKT